MSQNSRITAEQQEGHLGRALLVRCQICAHSKGQIEPESAFVPSGQLLNHIAAHLNYRPHLCTQCGFASIEPEELLRHSRQTQHQLIQFDGNHNEYLEEVCGMIAKDCEQKHSESLSDHYQKQQHPQRPSCSSTSLEFEGAADTIQGLVKQEFNFAAAFCSPNASPVPSISAQDPPIEISSEHSIEDDNNANNKDIITDLLTQRNKKKYIHDGFTYLKDNKSSSDGKRLFWCCARRNDGCKGRIWTSADEDRTFLQLVTPHTCSQLGDTSLVSADADSPQVQIQQPNSPNTMMKMLYDSTFSDNAHKNKDVPSRTTVNLVKDAQFHKCNYCNKEFIANHSVRTYHCSTHLNLVLFRCSMCTLEFRRPHYSRMNLHLSKIHKVKNPTIHMMNRDSHNWSILKKQTHTMICPIPGPNAPTSSSAVVL